MLLQSFTGASIRRVIDRAHARVPEHAHDWPVISLFVIGAYTNHTELGELAICGPSVILYRAGAAHRNEVSARGFEQIEIEFDPAWLGRANLAGAPVRRWIGGRVGALARSLAQACAGELSEQRLRAGLCRLLEEGAGNVRCAPPPWMSWVDRRLQSDPAASVTGLAQAIGLHPSWLGAAYRRAKGEGIPETAARLRVERAAQLLREADVSFARVAAEAGFCDQSHMNRTLRRVLGRTPSAVRRDRSELRKAACPRP